ncbi:MAG: hypothetical protein J2P18_05335, partial [Nocardia sp.]|nr:hypothetical protein [Nocardia sp.]
VDRIRWGVAMGLLPADIDELHLLPGTLAGVVAAIAKVDMTSAARGACAAHARLLGVDHRVLAGGRVDHRVLAGGH